LGVHSVSVALGLRNSDARGDIAMRLGFALIGALVVFDLVLALLASIGLISPWTAFALLAANPLAVLVVRAWRPKGR
jgi:hypothetical protein